MLSWMSVVACAAEWGWGCLWRVAWCWDGIGFKWDENSWIWGAGWSLLNTKSDHIHRFYWWPLGWKYTAQNSRHQGVLTQDPGREVCWPTAGCELAAHSLSSHFLCLVLNICPPGCFHWDDAGTQFLFLCIKIVRKKSGQGGCLWKEESFEKFQSLQKLNFQPLTKSLSTRFINQERI